MAEWRRYVAPAGFLLAVTIAVILIRSGLETGGHGASGAALPPLPTVATTTTRRTTTRRRSPARYWTVQAGDTFGVIASKTGVALSRLEELNPNVSSTSLHIGEKVRIG